MISLDNILYSAFLIAITVSFSLTDICLFLFFLTFIEPCIVICHHHNHISVKELGHLLTRSGLTYPEVSSKVCQDSFCRLGNSVSLPWEIYYGAFYLHVVSNFSCIPVICLKLVLFLISLQFVHLFCNIYVIYSYNKTNEMH